MSGENQEIDFSLKIIKMQISIFTKMYMVLPFFIIYFAALHSHF